VCPRNQISYQLNSKVILILIVFLTSPVCLFGAQSLNVFSVNKNGETYYGLKNTAGEVIVKPKNLKLEVCPIYDTYLLVVDYKHCLIINNRGETIYGPFSKYRGDFSNGIIATLFESKYLQTLVPEFCTKSCDNFCYVN